jgi:DNA segregation ATPase FtsK/SpoIIIE-like protein
MVVSLRDYGYGIEYTWKSRMESLIYAVSDYGLVSVIERLMMVGKYHKLMRKDCQDLERLFPMSDKALNDMYIDGVPNIVSFLGYTEEEHKDMVKSVLMMTEYTETSKRRKYSNNDIVIPSTVEEEEQEEEEEEEEEEETVGRSDNDDESVAGTSVADTSVVVDKDYEVTIINIDEEETIQEIPVNNACILPDQYMPTLKEIMDESNKIMDEARTKICGLFDFYVEQYQSKELKEIWKKRVKDCLQDSVLFNGSMLNDLHKELTVSLEEVIKSQEKYWEDEAKYLNEIKNNFCQNSKKMREKEKEIYKKDMESASIVCEERKQIVLELKKIDEVCYRQAFITYRNKYLHYIKRKEEKYNELCDNVLLFDKLNAQLCNIKEYKKLLKEQLNLNDILLANNDIKKMLKKICVAYTNVVTLEREYHSYDILAASFPCNFTI